MKPENKKRALLKPDLEATDLTALPLDELRRRGISGLIFDLDNTVTAWHSLDIAPEVAEWFALLPERGFCACILSNGHKERVEAMEALLHIPALPMAKKPFPGGFLRACAALELPPEKTAMVGDQLLTDVYGGNRAGLTTVLLTRLIDKREFIFTRLISRNIERLIRLFH